MAITLEYGTPLAAQLQDDVQRNLVEMGWSTGSADDTSLAEYIVINILSDKQADELTTELANDFLQISADEPKLVEFVKGVYVRAENLSSGGDAPMEQDVNQATENPSVQDTDMGDSGDATGDSSMYVKSLGWRLAHPLTDFRRPTGPKSMRNGGKTRGDKRMIGQMNRAMDRSGDAGLHKIRGSAGTGRIDSHAPRGPRGGLPKGPRGAMNNRGSFQQRGQRGAHEANKAYSVIANLPLDQQNVLVGYLQEQENAKFAASQHGRSNSLFHRIGNGHNAHSDAMELTSNASEAPVNRRPAPGNTLCSFNTTCTRAECHFAHQTPANPKPISVDLSLDCSSGESCSNFKCAAKHPSPAKAAQRECTFGAMCTKANCRFTHPTASACRNGADCKVEGCTFWHSKVECIHNPCTRASCPYKHKEGQKDLGRYQWVNPELKKEEHVSERKFDAADGQEELILPEKTEGIVAPEQTAQTAVE